MKRSVVTACLGSSKGEILRVKREKNIKEVVEEVGVFIVTHFFNECFEMKYSLFPKKVIAGQCSNEMRFIEKT